MNSNAFKQEVEAVLRQHNTTLDKMTFECWRGGSITKTLQNKNTNEPFTFTTVMRNAGIYQLCAKKENGAYVDVYTFCDR
jgi:hypothetical protein